MLAPRAGAGQNSGAQIVRTEGRKGAKTEDGGDYLHRAIKRNRITVP